MVEGRIMVAPNIRRVQTIRGQLSVRQYANTTPANIIVNPENSDQVLRVKSLVAANVDAATTYSISIAILRSGSLNHIVKTVDIPADSSLPIMLEQISIYLEEGDSLQIYSNDANKIHVVAMYEELSDIEYTDIREDTEPSPGVSVTVVPSTTSANEGSTITFNVSTTGIADGTTLYWTTNGVSGTINSSDFSGGQLTGSFTINTNAGSFTRTLSNDVTTEGVESFSISVRQTSTSGTILATSAIISVSDTSIAPTVSFVAGAGVDANTITIPASAQAGDIAVLFDAAADSAAFTINTTISGWTKVISEYALNPGGAGGSAQHQQVFVKVLSAGEPGTSITGSSVTTAPGGRRKAMAVFRRSTSISSFTFSGYTFEYNASAPANRTITSSSGTAPVIAIALYRIGGSANGFTFTPTQDGAQNGGADTALMRWKLFNTSPSNITIGMGDGGFNYLGGFYLTLT